MKNILKNIIGILIAIIVIFAVIAIIGLVVELIAATFNAKIFMDIIFVLLACTVVYLIKEL